MHVVNEIEIFLLAKITISVTSLLGFAISFIDFSNFIDKSAGFFNKTQNSCETFQKSRNVPWFQKCGIFATLEYPKCKIDRGKIFHDFLAVFGNDFFDIKTPTFYKYPFLITSYKKLKFENFLKAIFRALVSYSKMSGTQLSPLFLKNLTFFAFLNWALTWSTFHCHLWAGFVRRLIFTLTWKWVERHSFFTNKHGLRAAYTFICKYEFSAARFSLLMVRCMPLIFSIVSIS